ncbi:unnamed protein product, partial [Ectocarpus sp. 12 AP-2014]
EGGYCSSTAPSSCRTSGPAAEARYSTMASWTLRPGATTAAAAAAPTTIIAWEARPGPSPLTSKTTIAASRSVKTSRTSTGAQYWGSTSTCPTFATLGRKTSWRRDPKDGRGARE